MSYLPNFKLSGHCRVMETKSFLIKFNYCSNFCAVQEIKWDLPEVEWMICLLFLNFRSPVLCAMAQNLEHRETRSVRAVVRCGRWRLRRPVGCGRRGSSHQQAAQLPPSCWLHCTSQPAQHTHHTYSVRQLGPPTTIHIHTNIYFRT